MRWSTYHLGARIATEPGLPGFFLHHSALSRHSRQLEWECPWCGHSVLFTAADQQAAESAAHSHVISEHGVRLWSDVMGAIDMLRAEPPSE